MSFLIKIPVTATFNFSSFSGWYGWFPAIFIDIVDQLLTVISTVREHAASFYIYMFQYGNREIDVITLPFTEHYIHRISICVYCRMDFGTGTSPAVSDFV